MRGRTFGVLMGLVAAGCGGPMGTLATAVLTPPALTTRPVGRVEGRDCSGLLLSALGPSPSLEKAIRNALTQAPGADAIANAQLVSERGGLPPFWMTDCLVVRGDAVRVGAGS